MEAVIEWQRWSDETCSSCGHHLSETLDPELEGAYETTAVVCHACAAREAAFDEFAGQHGVKIIASLIPEAVEYLRTRKEVTDG